MRSSSQIVRRLNPLDSSQVDFRDPANFFHDVNSVAGLLKQFFRDLPDPLLTRENYQSFIEAASKSPLVLPVLRQDPCLYGLYHRD